MKKEFYDNKVYTIINYFISYIQLNLYFIFCNMIPVFYILLSTLNPDVFSTTILFLTLIPTGPALGAIYSTVGKALREKDMFFASSYFDYYKSNFKSNLKMWLVILTLSFILLIDFQYFYLMNNLHIVFIVPSVILLLISVYAFPINSRFNITVKDLFLTSFYYMVKYFKITIFKVALLLASYYLLKNIFIGFVLFMPASVCFILMYYDNKMLMELEKRSISNN